MRSGGQQQCESGTEDEKPFRIGWSNMTKKQTPGNLVINNAFKFVRNEHTIIPTQSM